MPSRAHAAFTLVEILIVVVILGILAAISIPLFASASSEAASNTTLSELHKIRRHVGVYQARHNGDLPPGVMAGGFGPEEAGSWGPLVGADHLHAPPVNAWVGGANSRTIAFGVTPDVAFQTDYGWIYNDETGQVWAGGFDEHDRPIPRD